VEDALAHIAKRIKEADSYLLEFAVKSRSGVC
jgi:hypothetical protein